MVRLDSGGWRITGVSVAGTSHSKSGRAGEDACAAEGGPGGAVLLAAADGAGSALRGGEGAAAAVRAALAAARGRLAAQAPESEDGWRGLLAGVLADARSALEALAGETAALGDLGTTLILAVLAPEGVAVVQVGDGAVVAQDGPAHYRTLTFPDQGEYLNETVFLTSAGYLDRAQYCVVTGILPSGIALLTDGLHMLALTLADNEPHPPFFAPLFSFAARASATEGELAGFLESDRVCERTDDDKTLLLAVRA